MNPMMMPPNFNFAHFNNNPQIVHKSNINIIQKNSSSFVPYNQISNQNQVYLDLLNQNMEVIPRNFTISTNNKSYKFNTEFLTDTSPVIKKYTEENPDSKEYHIDINDENCVMQKIEDLYLGQTITINIQDLFLIRKFLEVLNITSCPIFMLPESTQLSYYSVPTKAEVLIDRTSLTNFLQKEIPKSFTIISNKKEYNCNIFGVNSSKVIRELREKNPDINQYVYNSEFDEENDDIKLICDFFNFERVQITVDNMESLRKIAEDLQITFILDDVNNFINSYQKAVQLIDDQKTIIETNDEIFNLLYNIKQLTIDGVKNSLLNSIWVTTEENICELVACIFQVIRSGFHLQNYIIELIILLDQSANETNCLDIFMPFFIKQMKFTFFVNKFYCIFFYKMTQKGLITLDEIVNYICYIDDFYSKDQIKYRPEKINMAVSHTPAYHNNITLWFFPELSKIRKFKGNEISPVYDNQANKFLQMFYPNDIERFKKLREAGEPDDELTRSILYDDVDTLQLILSKTTIDINNIKLPPNIFEVFSICDEISFINYAAENGSIKCFKYLLLNHAKMDEYTFGYAVYGGNIEIIRLVNQYFHNDISINTNEENFPNPSSFGIGDSCEYFKDSLLNPIIPAIMTHQNDLFDWILEQKYICKGIIGNSLLNLAINSVKNGNAHSFIQCIDKGLDMRSSSSGFNKIFNDLILSPCQYGFYGVLQLAFSLTEKVVPQNDQNLINTGLIQSSVNFGNLSIYKFIDQKIAMGSMYRGQALINAIECDYDDIIKYIIEQDYTPTTSMEFVTIYSSVARKKSPSLFNYINSKYNFQYLVKKNDVSLPDMIIILNHACISGNFEAAQKITDAILQIEPKANFTNPFVNSIYSNCDDICQYFIDKKVFLNCHQLSLNMKKIACGNCNIIINLINSVSPEMRETFLKGLLNDSIEKGNKKLSEYLLSKNPPNFKSLFAAVNSHDADIVDLVLKYNNKPSFINQISNSGTALNVAVCNEDLPIVKRLLDTPGIDPSLYEKNNHTPLVSAIVILNIDIINLLLDYYGDDIQSQMWQLDDALKEILKKLSGNFNQQNRVNQQRYDDDSDDDYDEIPETPENVEMNNMNANFLTNNQGRIFTVLNRLMQIKNIDLNCHVHKYTLLTYACETNEIELLKVLLKSDNVNVNSYAPNNGNTPLMIAIEKKNFEIVHILIESPRVNINLKNYSQQTALTIAVAQHQQSIIDLLVNSKKFDPEESCLDYAFYISEGEITKQLYSIKALNVNYKHDPCTSNFEKYNDDAMIDPADFGLVDNAAMHLSNSRKVYVYETTLIHAVNQKNVEMVDLIISHPSFDPVQSQIVAAIFVSVFQKSIDIFHKLLKLVNNDVNLFSQNGESLLSYSITCDSSDIMNEILNHESFDSVKSNILDAFCNAACLDKNSKNMFYDNYDMPDEEDQRVSINLLNDLCEFDENHDHLIDFNHLLPNGKSFFTSIYIFIQNDNELAQFFLDHGSDPNMPDKQGTYPLEHAIQQCTSDLVAVLLSSPKIDISIKLNGVSTFDMKNATFLHLAAISHDDRILEEFFERNLIDINVTDDFGETPLMKAVMCKKLFNIVQFFKRDDLDYQHRNNEGKNALEMSEELPKNRRLNSAFALPFNVNQIGEIHPEEKKEYLLKIVENINTSISAVFQTMQTYTG